MLLVALWPGLAGAAALGLAVGAFCGWPARPAVPLSLLAAAALLAGAALAGVVPGAAGLWLESAALLLPPYLAGCAAGSALHRATARGRGPPTRTADAAPRRARPSADGPTPP